MPRATSAIVNAPASRASTEWITTWNSRSPSSSSRPSYAPAGIGSAPPRGAGGGGAGAPPPPPPPPPTGRAGAGGGCAPALVRSPKGGRRGRGVRLLGTQRPPPRPAKSLGERAQRGDPPRHCDATGVDEQRREVIGCDDPVEIGQRHTRDRLVGETEAR